MAKRESKDIYELYLVSVQDPISDVERITSIYQEFNSYIPLLLREDFSGTFALSCTWVQSDDKRKAIAIDLDHETLNYGKNNYLINLSDNEQNRIDVIHANSITKSNLVDVIAAFNFSYCLIHKRSDLLEYFIKCNQSLEKNGIIIMDILGGSDSEIPEIQETEIVRDHLEPFTFEFERKDFNPISRLANYAIHFKFPKNKGMPNLINAFTYYFRMWTIPEIRDLLKEAGFSTSHIYWENDLGDYYKTENAENTISWNALIVGVK